MRLICHCGRPAGKHFRRVLARRESLRAKLGCRNARYLCREIRTPRGIDAVKLVVIRTWRVHSQRGDVTLESIDPGFRLRAITEQPVFLIAPRLRNVRTSRGHAYASIIASYRLAFRLTTRGLINLYTLSLTRPNLSKSSELKRKAIEARSSYPWKLNSRWFYRYTCVGEVSIL